jgi:cephalosporin hydroxylase
MEAVGDFLAEGHPFEVDASREKFMMTFNPGGFLRRAR